MKLNDVYITGTSAYLPNDPVSNDQIEDVLGLIGGKASRAKATILRSNGIKQRYYALDPKTSEQNYTNAQITAAAVRGLFSNEVDLNRIACLVTGTTIPDQIGPNHAVMVHGELKIPACEVVSTSGICLSGITALKYAYMAVLCGEHSSAVSTGSELVSPILRARNFEEESRAKLEKLQERPEVGFDKDFLRWMLSDGSGAFLLETQPSVSENQPSLKIEWLEVMSFADQHEACMYIGATKNPDGSLRGWHDHHLAELTEQSVMAIKQDVRQLNENVIPVTLVQALEKVIAKTGLQSKDIDYFLPHISSMYFYGKVKDALSEMNFDIPEDKWFTNLATKGNTGAASIYIMLDELLKSGRVKSGEKILCFIPESGRFSSSFMLLTAV